MRILSASTTLLFLLALSAWCRPSPSNWAITREPDEIFIEAQRAEALGQDSLRAGIWTESDVSLDIPKGRFRYAIAHHHLEWQPFLFGGAAWTSGSDPIVPGEAGHTISYHYGKRLSAYVDGFLYRRLKNETEAASPFLSTRGSEENLSAYTYDHVIGQDQFDARQSIAYLDFRSDILNIGFGRRTLRWGQGFNGGLILSGNAGPVNLFYHLNKKVGTSLSLTAFFGAPDYSSSFFPDNLPETTKFAQGERYCAGHRVEWAFKNRFRLAVNELVNLNGQRELNRYFNPLQVYYLTSSGSELASNLLASIEVWIKVRDGLAVYGEILNDDITMFEEGNPTRLAYQVGLFSPGWGRGKEIDFRAEYTYVRAYTYTHYSYSKNWHIWADRIVGYWTGPDSDHLYAHVEKRITFSNRLRLSGQLLRQGEKGMQTFWDRSTEGTGESVPYLSGTVVNTMGTLISWEQEYTDYLKVFITGGNQLRWNRSASPQNTMLFQALLQFEL